MEQGCSFKGSLFFLLLSLLFLCAREAWPLFSLSTLLFLLRGKMKTVLWSKLLGPGKMFVTLSPLHCIASYGAGSWRMTQSQVHIPSSTSWFWSFLLSIQLFGVHPNCITWVYFTCLKMFTLVYTGPKPSLLLPYHRASPFLEMGFQLGGADKYTPFLDTAVSLPLLLRMSACCTSPDLLLSQCPLPSVFTFFAFAVLTNP